MLSRPDGFMLYGKMGVDFFSTPEWLYPNKKIRLRLHRARPNFYTNSDNPNVSLEIVDCSLYTRRIALKDDYHKKRLNMLAYNPVEFNFLKTLAMNFIIPARQKQFFPESILNNAPVRWIAIAMNNKTLHSLDPILKIQSGSNNLISDKLEYSEEVSQSKTLMLLIIVAFMLQQ